MTSWMMSIRGLEPCSANTFCAKIDACSAAVGAQDWRIGTTSLSIVLGSPTTVSSYPLLVQVCREVGGRGVGVVAADGVQDVDAVGLEPLGRDVQGVLTLLDQPALDQVLDVGQLDPAVADRAAAEVVQQVGLGCGSRRRRRGSCRPAPRGSRAGSR
jgi:hypothetical protein